MLLKNLSMNKFPLAAAMAAAIVLSPVAQAQTTSMDSNAMAGSGANIQTQEGTEMNSRVELTAGGVSTTDQMVAPEPSAGSNQGAIMTKSNETRTVKRWSQRNSPSTSLGNQGESSFGASGYASSSVLK